MELKESDVHLSINLRKQVPLRSHHLEQTLQLVPFAHRTHAEPCGVSQAGPVYANTCDWNKGAINARDIPYILRDKNACMWIYPGLLMLLT